MLVRDKGSSVFRAEQFQMRSSPKEWPIGIEWGGSLTEGGTGCYRFMLGSIHYNDVKDGDWVLENINPQLNNLPHRFRICSAAKFAENYQPIEEAPVGVSDEGQG